jgi:signal transduction histidine kinase
MPPRDADRSAGAGHRAWLVPLARTLLGLTLLCIAAGIVVSLLDTGPAGPAAGEFAFAGAFGVFPIVGYVLAARRPDNSISWVLLGIGIAFGLDFFIGSYASYALGGGAGGHDLGALAAAIDQPMWVPIVVLPVTFLILLFPDGHLPSPRWRRFAWVLGVGAAVVFLVILLGPGPVEDIGFPNVRNPLGQEWLRSALPFLLALIGLIPIGIVASLVSLVRRYRRSTGIERLQLRWLVSAAGVVAVLYSIALPVGLVGGWNSTSTPAALQVLQTISIASFALIPVAIGVSVLRYHLFDIDVVINRALLFGALAVFITVVYVSVVVGVGAVVGSRADPVLSAAAAAIVALVFQPARRRAQRLADRLVYGKRATPYEVLSEFSERLGNVYAADELLPRMARALADATGAARADVWVHVGDVLRSESTYPADAEPMEPIDGSEDLAATVSESTMLEPVRHQGELLGALSITKRPGESIKPAEEKLVRDLAAQGGLVMRNVRLFEELRASRQRLVAAQDEARRRLERNLHDGAQQQLVALSVQLRLLEQMVGRDADKERALAASLQVATTDAIEQLRDLARGIYPPLLADKGLVVALEAQARKTPVPTAVRSEGVGRYPQDTEAAVYFCVLEALNNVAKYSHATAVEVVLAQTNGNLTFRVTDDGAGFDTGRTGYGTGLQGMADRLDAIGGDLRIHSTVGEGTTVEGRVRS